MFFQRNVRSAALFNKYIIRKMLQPKNAAKKQKRPVRAIIRNIHDFKGFPCLTVNWLSLT